MSQSTRETQTWRKRSSFTQSFKQLGPLGPLGLQVLEVQKEASDSSQAELTSPASAVVCIRWAWSDCGSDWILCILNFHLALARIFPCDKYHEDPCFLHVKVPVLSTTSFQALLLSSWHLGWQLLWRVRGRCRSTQIWTNYGDPEVRKFARLPLGEGVASWCCECYCNILQHICNATLLTSSDYWRYRGNLGQVLPALHVLQKSPASDTFR